MRRATLRRGARLFTWVCRQHLMLSALDSHPLLPLPTLTCKIRKRGVGKRGWWRGAAGRVWGRVSLVLERGMGMGLSEGEREREKGGDFWFFGFWELERKKESFSRKGGETERRKTWVRKRGGFVSGRPWKTRDLELEELVSWSTSTILAFQEVQYQQVTSEG